MLILDLSYWYLAKGSKSGILRLVKHHLNISKLYAQNFSLICENTQKWNI